jgi:predicted DNA-binding transcriptional regulator AlpA
MEKLKNENMTWEKVKEVLHKNKLSVKHFTDWMNGQTCPIVEVKGKKQIGFYKYDVDRYIQWQLKGIEPIWD